MLAITALALLLTFYHLGSRSLWLDEALSVEFVHMSWGELWDFWLNQEIGMGPYYAALKVWTGVFGTSEASVRTLSVLPAIGTVWVTWRLGARMFGNRAALLAALVLAISPQFVAYAQEARAYAAVMFLVTASTLALVRAVERPTMGRWLLYTALMVLAIYVHLFAGLAMAAHLVYLLFVPPRNLRWAPMAVAAAEGALLLVPVLVFMVRVGAGYLSWIPPRDFSDLPLFFRFLTDHNGWLIAAYAVAGGAGVVWALTAWGRPAFSSRARPVAMVLALVFLPVITATIVSMLLQPLLISRYLLYALPAVALLVGVGVAYVRPSWLGGALLAAIAVISLAGIADVYGSPKEEWRSAVEYMSKTASANDGVLVYKGFVDAPLLYYLRREPDGTRPQDIEQVWDARDSASLARAVSKVADHKRFWLVLSNDFDASATSRVRSAVATQFRLVDERAFEGVRVVRYER